MPDSGKSREQLLKELIELRQENNSLKEEKLRQSEELFSRAFKSWPVSMAIVDRADGSYIEVNDTWQNVTGYSKDEVIGQDWRELGIFNIDNPQESRQSLSEHGSVRNREMVYRTKCGKIRHGLSSADVIYLNGKECALVATLDITEQKNYEKEMARLDRLNLIGEMAAGIGHEVRNPMTTVRGFLQLLSNKEEYSKDSEHFQLMIDELDRANSIITEFLSLARNKAVNLKEQNLNSIIKNLFPLIKADAMVSDKIINLELAEVPELLLDEKEIRQMILNLVHNGIEATPSGGKITIRTFGGEGEVILAVTDEGSGIAPELLEKIGTPFFTTKDAGTGLGLPICYSIAARQNAKIEIETGAAGTTFFVRFYQDRH